MAPQAQRPFVRIYAEVSVIACSLGISGVSQAMESHPPLSAACLAWYSHITNLIDEHRVAQELADDQLSEIIRLFNDARFACTALRFAEGLAIYDDIPLGPSHHPRRPLSDN